MMTELKQAFDHYTTQSESGDVQFHNRQCCHHSIAMDLARRHPSIDEVVSSPAIQLNSSSVDFSLMAWCKDAATAVAAKYDLFKSLKKTFDAREIEIPYAYQNVVLKSIQP